MTVADSYPEFPSRKSFHIRTQVAFCLQGSRGQERDGLRWEHGVTGFDPSHFLFTGIDTKERKRKDEKRETTDDKLGPK